MVNLITIFLPQFCSSFLDVVNLLKALKYPFFKQLSNAGFIEVFNPKADSENMLLTQLEISDSVLTKLGVLGV